MELEKLTNEQKEKLRIAKSNFNQAKMSYMMQQYGVALGSAKKSVEADPQFASGLGILAAIYAKLGNCDSARTYITKALMAKPGEKYAMEAEKAW